MASSSVTLRNHLIIIETITNVLIPTAKSLHEHASLEAVCCVFGLLHAQCGVVRVVNAIETCSEWLDIDCDCRSFQLINDGFFTQCIAECTNVLLQQRGSFSCMVLLCCLLPLMSSGNRIRVFDNAIAYYKTTHDETPVVLYDGGGDDSVPCRLLSSLASGTSKRQHDVILFILFYYIIECDISNEWHRLTSRQLVIQRTLKPYPSAPGGRDTAPSLTAVLPNIKSIIDCQCWNAEKKMLITPSASPIDAEPWIVAIMQSVITHLKTSSNSLSCVSLALWMCERFSSCLKYETGTRLPLKMTYIALIEQVSHSLYTYKVPTTTESTDTFDRDALDIDPVSLQNILEHFIRSLVDVVSDIWPLKVRSYLMRTICSFIVFPSTTMDISTLQLTASGDGYIKMLNKILETASGLITGSDQKKRFRTTVTNRLNRSGSLNDASAVSMPTPANTESVISGLVTLAQRCATNIPVVYSMMTEYLNNNGMQEHIRRFKDVHHDGVSVSRTSISILHDNADGTGYHHLATMKHCSLLCSDDVKYSSSLLPPGMSSSSRLCFKSTAIPPFSIRMSVIAVDPECKCVVFECAVSSSVKGSATNAVLHASTSSSYRVSLSQSQINIPSVTRAVLHYDQLDDVSIVMTIPADGGYGVTWRMPLPVCLMPVVLNDVLFTHMVNSMPYETSIHGVLTSGMHIKDLKLCISQLVVNDVLLGVGITWWGSRVCVSVRHHHTTAWYNALSDNITRISSSIIRSDAGMSVCPVSESSQPEVVVTVWCDDNDTMSIAACDWRQFICDLSDGNIIAL